jgi:hypothetical protein
MHGIVFIQVAGGGRFALYNLELKQALKKRFDNVVQARGFAINKLMDRTVR